MWSSKLLKIAGLAVLASTPFAVNSDYNPLKSNPIQSIPARDVWILTNSYVNGRENENGKPTELYIWVRVGNTEEASHELATVTPTNTQELEKIVREFSREDFDIAYMTGYYVTLGEELNPRMKNELPKELRVQEILINFKDGTKSEYAFKTNL